MHQIRNDKCDNSKAFLCYLEVIGVAQTNPKNERFLLHFDTNIPFEVELT